MRTVQKLTLDDARCIMEGAESKAREIGVDMDIAITDDNGSLLMFHRMDNGRITSIDVAISKAFTAINAGVWRSQWSWRPRLRNSCEQSRPIYDCGRWGTVVC